MRDLKIDLTELKICKGLHVSYKLQLRLLNLRSLLNFSNDYDGLVVIHMGGVHQLPKKHVLGCRCRMHLLC